MEKFQVLREEALKNYRMADHMLNVTYPLVNDTKLLLGVTQNMYSSLTLAMASILHHERLFKLVPSFQETFESQFQILHQRCSKKHSIPQEQLNLMLELKNILQLHKKSPIEFQRKDRFIICTSNYQIKAVTQNELKKHLQTAKAFLRLMGEITSRNQRFFNNQ